MSEEKRYCQNKGKGYCGECVSDDLEDEITRLKEELGHTQSALTKVLTENRLNCEELSKVRDSNAAYENSDRMFRTQVVNLQTKLSKAEAEEERLRESLSKVLERLGNAPAGEILIIDEAFEIVEQALQGKEKS